MKPEALSPLGNSILFRGLNWIGDAIMSLPTIHAVHLAHPEASITVAAPGWCADIYRICSDVGHVIEIDHKKGPAAVFSEVRNAGKIRGKFASAIVLPNSFRSAFSTFLAGIPLRYGYATDSRKMFLTHAPPNPEKKCHTVEYYRPLLERMGIDWTSGNESFNIHLEDKTIEEANGLLKKKGLLPNRKYIGFAPGAAWGPSKQWPAKHFSRAISALLNKENRQALLFGSPEDYQLVEQIIQNRSQSVINLAGAFQRLRHLVVAISNCKILVTNDSGPMHIAAAMGVPTLALFGPTDENVSGPWSPGATSRILRAEGCHPCYNPHCQEQGSPCMELISPEQVIDAAEEMLFEVDEGKAE